MEEVLPDSRTFENADFLFRSHSVVAEPKEIQTEFARSPSVCEGFRVLIERVMGEDMNLRCC